jgi:hypothetical protein
VTARCIPAKLHIKIGVFSGSNIALQMSYYDTLKNYIESVLFDGASADAPLYAADSRALYNASPVASRML